MSSYVTFLSVDIWQGEDLSGGCVSTTCRQVSTEALLAVMTCCADTVPAHCHCGRISLELPSGLVEANESLDEAALRELEEETGYKGVVKV